MQAWDTNLDEIAALVADNNYIMVGSGGSWVREEGATARNSLGLSIGSDVQEWSSVLDDIVGLFPSNSYFIVGDGANWTRESPANAALSLGLGTTDSPTFVGLTLSANLVLAAYDEIYWSARTSIYGTVTDLYLDADDDVFLRPDDDLLIYYNTDGTGYCRFDGSQQYVIFGSTGTPSERVHVAAGNLRLDDSYHLNWGGDTTYISGVHASALHLVGATDVNITSTADDVEITAGDDVKVTADDFINLITSTYDIDLDSARAIVLDPATDVDIEINGTGYARFDGSAHRFYIGNAVTNPSDRLHVGAGNIRLDSGYRINWGGTNTFIDGINSGALTLEGDTYAYLNAEAGDVQIEASDDVILKPSDDIWIWGAGSAWAKFDGTYKRLGVNDGTTQPSYPLDVHNNATTYVANVENDSTSIYCDGIRVKLTVAAAGTGNYFVGFYDAGSLVGRIAGNGTGVNYTDTSDARLKENIRDTSPLTDAMMALKVRTFDWKDKPTKDTIGFVAQELLEVWPFAVSDGGKRNERQLCTVERRVVRTKKRPVLGSKGVAQVDMADKPVMEDYEEIEWKASETAELLPPEIVASPPEDLRVVSSRALTEDDIDYAYMGVDYGKLTPLLAKALQEEVTARRALEAQVEAAEALAGDAEDRAVALEARVATMEKQIKRLLTASSPPDPIAIK